MGEGEQAAPRKPSDRRSELNLLIEYSKIAKKLDLGSL